MGVFLSLFIYLFIYFFYFFILFYGMTWHNWALTAETKKYHLEAVDEVAPRKRLASLLKLALDLMAGIWAGREFHNWAVDGRNDLAW